MKEFKPAFRFLGFFVGAYLVLNIAYGLWISSFGSKPDTVTNWVTIQTSVLLNLTGQTTYTQIKPGVPAISIFNQEGVVLSVFEGCNGLNIMIVFASFLIAFGGERKKMFWFALTGLVIIHAANLVRVIMLYFIAEYKNQYFYYAHKYVLTAFLYAVVFVLWWWWIEKVSRISIRKAMINKS
jgi:exosortase family protein XrtF